LLTISGDSGNWLPTVKKNSRHNSLLNIFCGGFDVLACGLKKNNLLYDWNFASTAAHGRFGYFEVSYAKYLT